MSNLYVVTERVEPVVHNSEVIGNRKIFECLGSPIGCEYQEAFEHEALTLPAAFTLRGGIVGTGGVVNVRHKSGDHPDPEASFRQMLSTLEKKAVLVNLSTFKVATPTPKPKAKPKPPAQTG